MLVCIKIEAYGHQVTIWNGRQSLWQWLGELFGVQTTPVYNGLEVLTEDQLVHLLRRVTLLEQQGLAEGEPLSLVTDGCRRWTYWIGYLVGFVRGLLKL